jgi:SNF2 family DNA or RNA helicase
LRELNPVVIHGAVPYLSVDEDEFSREELIRSFRNDPECRVLIANPAACAESISLHTVCHHAVYLDRSFNCAHYLQSLDRIHRLGLPKETTTSYYLLIATVHARLKDKLKNMRSVIEGDLPGQMPGYWSDDLGDEENVDDAQVEEHIRRLFSTRER